MTIDGRCDVLGEDPVRVPFLPRCVKPVGHNGAHEFHLDSSGAPEVVDALALAAAWFILGEPADHRDRVRAAVVAQFRIGEKL